MSEDRYPFKSTEKKWKKIWHDRHDHEVDLDIKPDKKQYTLVMFSYPSASKLHIGHWWNYGPTDTFSRFKKMQGYKIFEPMGFDAFGLPAENFAIKMDTHPKEVTETAIASIEEQLEAIGAMYDWRHMVVTSRPDYYKWTQWLFLQLYKNKLAYQKEGLVNWCPSCQTVLANEQVNADGSCDRCGAGVNQRKMTQWYFKITEYADKLLEGLEEIDWPESTKKRQQNWIGHSEGANIKFKIEGHEEDIEVFTTRPDTLFGVTYVVLAPENDLVPILTREENKKDVDEYIQKALRTNEVERTSTVREKTGVFTGSYVQHPFTGEKLPIWVADYVLGSYGTGAVMAVPAHDQRDFEFALKHSLPMKVVVRPKKNMIEVEELREAYSEPGIMVNSGSFSGVSSLDGKKAVSEKLEEIKRGGPSTTYRLRDWSISRQRYWGAPIPVVHCEHCGVVPVPDHELPVTLPEEIVDFRPKGTSPLGGVEEWINCKCPECGNPAKRDPDTMDTFVDSSFYHLRYLSASDADKPFNLERMKEWLPIDTYVGGADHSTGHLIYFRFITRFLHDIGWCPVTEPAKRMVHQGIIKQGGIKMSKSKGNVVNPDIFVKKHGSDVFRMYLMFMGAYLEGGDWSDEGINGIDRFLNRIWRLVCKYAGDSFRDETPIREDYPEELYRTLNHTIKEVGKDLENFSFNTAISRMMELVNGLYGWLGDEDKAQEKVYRILKILVKIIAPFAPHFAEESWEKLHGNGSVFDQEWPEYSEKALTMQTFTMVIQVNGKIRDKMDVSSESSKEEMQEIALKSDKIQEYLEKGKLRKAIVIPGKLVNLVIK